MSGEVTRRSALTASAVAVVGAVVGFVFGRNSDAKKAGTPGGGYSDGGSSASGKLLTQLDRVPEGGGVIVGSVVVTRPSAGQVHAFSSTCTHLGCTVNRVSGGKIFCPCHGSTFNANTGAVLQGPAGTPLPEVQVTVKNGGVYTA
jgi:Rieske Fe-S protein